MINCLIKGIASKLYEVFKNITIYTEKVPQGFVTPSFYIKCLTHNDELKLFESKKKITRFDITYFPSKDSLENEREINGTLAKLVDNMRVIQAEGHKIKGFDISNEKVDGVLHYFVSYNITLLKDKININMEDLKERTDVNG